MHKGDLPAREVSRQGADDLPDIRMTRRRVQKKGRDPKRSKGLVPGEARGDVGPAGGKGVYPRQGCAHDAGEGDIHLSRRQEAFPDGMSRRVEIVHHKEASAGRLGQNARRQIGVNIPRHFEPSRLPPRAVGGRRPARRDPHASQQTFDNDDPPVIELRLENV